MKTLGAFPTTGPWLESTQDLLATHAAAHMRNHGWSSETHAVFH